MPHACEAAYLHLSQIAEMCASECPCSKPSFRSSSTGLEHAQVVQEFLGIDVSAGAAIPLVAAALPLGWGSSAAPTGQRKKNNFLHCEAAHLVKAYLGFTGWVAVVRSDMEWWRLLWV